MSSNDKKMEITELLLDRETQPENEDTSTSDGDRAHGLSIGAQML